MTDRFILADNVFVFVVIFAALHVPRHLQHRVLFWGVLTALILRGVMILGVTVAASLREPKR